MNKEYQLTRVTKQFLLLTLGSPKRLSQHSLVRFKFQILLPSFWHFGPLNTVSNETIWVHPSNTNILPILGRFFFFWNWGIYCHLLDTFWHFQYKHFGILNISYHLSIDHHLKLNLSETVPLYMPRNVHSFFSFRNTLSVLNDQSAFSVYVANLPWSCRLSCASRGFLQGGHS